MSARRTVDVSGFTGALQPFEVAPDDATALHRIGRLRVAVWTHEGSLAPDAYPTGVWLDDFDPVARHWVVADERGEWVACARLTVHDRLLDSPDGYIWEREHRPLPVPVANIAKLVVAPSARGRGVAHALNVLRVEEARRMGARSVTVTASSANARLLATLGFIDIGVVEYFPNRPTTPFVVMELVFTTAGAGA